MKEYVIFKLNNEYYGIDINNVENIEKVMTITRVPYASEYVAGVINLRGNIAPVVNLRARFGFEQIEFDEDSRTIILNVDSHRIGILVDESSEVLQLEDDEIDMAPKLSKKETKLNYVSRIGKKNDRIVMIVDLYKILNIINENEE